MPTTEERVSMTPKDEMAFPLGPVPEVGAVYKPVAQATVDELVHVVVVQTVPSIVAVGVALLYPKLRPLMVTELMPVITELENKDDAVGASKEKPFILVPTTALTVMVAPILAAVNGPVRPPLQVTLVEVLHDVVVHGTTELESKRLAVGVEPTPPKFRPSRVRVAVPEGTRFAVIA